MQRVTLLLGSNDIAAETLVTKATEILDIAVGKIERISGDYRSAAYGFTAEREFVNRAVVLTTEYDAYEVLHRINAIEALLGRNRTEEQAVKSARGEAYASRPIDIDIIFYGDETFSDQRLTIPYHFLDEREYALRPVAEIVAERKHPALSKTPREMLEALTNRL
jgi:2-amino-4-hydroxy-6-hydroxymethyldihydropteridine diphosphokinase